MSFLKPININVDGKLNLGSVIKITVVFDVAPDSVNITIEDSGGTDQVDQVAMTVDDNSSKVYTYTYQSSETDLEGKYEVFIRGVSGSNTSLAYTTFNLTDREDD